MYLMNKNSYKENGNQRIFDYPVYCALAANVSVILMCETLFLFKGKRFNRLRDFID